MSDDNLRKESILTENKRQWFYTELIENFILYIRKCKNIQTFMSIRIKGTINNCRSKWL